MIDKLQIWWLWMPLIYRGQERIAMKYLKEEDSSKR